MSRMLPYGLVLALACSTTGCVSTAIAELGRHPGGYETRAQTRRNLGTPVASGVRDDVHWEEYRYRGKLREDTTGAMMISGMTFGLAEVVLLPMAIVNLPAQVVEVHRLRFEYDQSGRIVNFEQQPFDVDVDVDDDQPVDSPNRSSTMSTISG